MALTFDIHKTGGEYANAEKLLDLKHLADLVLPISTRLDATLATVNSLLSMSSESHLSLTAQVVDELKAQIVRLEGYLASSKLLQKRIEGITSSASVAVDY
jgi:hypothetical protein